MSVRYPADNYEITIPQGEDFEKVWVYYPDGPDADPADLSTYTGASQLRRNYSDAEALLDFDVELGSDGSVAISAANADTSALSPGRTYYDVEITDADGKVKRLVAGRARITPEVTR